MYGCMYVHYYNYWYQALYGINQARAQRVPGVWAERDMGYIRMYVIHTIYPMPRMPQAIPREERKMKPSDYVHSSGEISSY
jgi:hypothetical protein